MTGTGLRIQHVCVTPSSTQTMSVCHTSSKGHNVSHIFLTQKSCLCDINQMDFSVGLDIAVSHRPQAHSIAPPYGLLAGN